MKLVLSRKGFDTANGRVPSPILPDGTLCSLPIPDRASQIKYRDIACGDLDLGKIVEDLTNQKIPGDFLAHLDPDLNPTALSRRKDWKGIFGPLNAAQTHLNNNGFGVGDLFLFFGWFRATEWHKDRLRYVRSAPHLHVLFGWLQVGTIRQARDFSASDRKWADYHPHFHPKRYGSATIHVGADCLSLPKPGVELPGYGVFPTFSSALRLTAFDATRSTWCLPSWFYPDGRKPLSHHGDLKRWRKVGNSVHLTTVPIGQEFVLDCLQYPESADWLLSLFTIPDNVGKHEKCDDPFTDNVTEHQARKFMSKTIENDRRLNTAFGVR